MGREVELKLEIAPRDAKRLRRHPALAAAEPREQEQLSVYFDTKTMKLSKAHLTLRVRQIGGAFVQTVKAEGTSAGMFDRPEWERPVRSLEPEAAAAAGTPVADLLGPGAFAKLAPVIRSQVRRTRWHVERDGARIEVALDEGAVEAGGAEHAISEVEIELLDGDRDAIFHLARNLGSRLPVRLGVLSKAERGFALAEGRLDRVTKALPLALRADMTAAEGFTSIVLSCLKHFRLNEPLIAAVRDPAALHQARVAMRRLRSAFSLFAPIIRDDEGFRPLREELRWFTGQLGEARNLDVFLKRLDAGASERPKLEAAREAEYDRIIATLSSKRFLHLVLNLVAWLLTGAWRSRKRAAKPLTSFTSKRIDRLWHDIALRGVDLASLDEEPRHRLRIDIKKIRYALEFVAGLHRGAEGAQRRFGAALEGLQESLGHLNDMATAREIAAQHLGGDEAAPGSDVAAEQAEHLRDAAKHFSRLEKAGPYWRAA
jgi:triphosphatase